MDDSGSDRDAERDAAVAKHLEALDDEIARLRRLEAAMDQRIADAEDERREIAERMAAPDDDQSPDQ
jgi:hypothetical protein